MGDYYNSDDLARFGEIGSHAPELFRKFMDWYGSAMEPGLLTKREKALIALGVAAQIPCPYCIYYHTVAAKAAGASDEEVKEAVHMSSLVRHWSTVLQGNQYDLEAFKAETDAAFKTE